MEDYARLNRESREIWDAKAAFWDDRMGDGNLFQQMLVGPAAERLLNVQADQTILDVACGNGVFARRLGALGARVVATDFSQRFLDLAAARGPEVADRIEYRLVDATDETALLGLGDGRFDAAVCNMALMDMPVIEPLFRALTRLLRPGAPFVFTVQHPAFNSNAVRFGLEEDESTGIVTVMRYVRLAEYLRVPPGKGAGMPGDPEPHWYFHRPLGELLGACFAAGFVLDGLEEPAFRPEDASGPPLSWTRYTEIPPVLVARLRVR